MEKSRDPAQRWEFFVQCQFQALKVFSRRNNCLLTSAAMPKNNFGKGGMEHEIFHHPQQDRFWKATSPNLAGFGPSGYFTPGGYLRRLRLSNLIFNDDVRFEGVLERPSGASIVTSQQAVHPHPERFVPTQEEISGLLTSLGFEQTRGTAWYRAADGITLGDCHDRNFIRTPVASIVAIDVQPVLDDGHAFEDVIPCPSTFS
ncbi:hypothetical protein AAFN60_18420 [Roseibacillus persicicus]|uniref:putative polyvalent protein kinase domain-containing protein n=1 Tax=Roseibacillus persicicus TaxID=454148 RepID=UPI00398BAF39